MWAWFNSSRYRWTLYLPNITDWRAWSTVNEWTRSSKRRTSLESLTQRSTHLTSVAARLLKPPRSSSGSIKWRRREYRLLGVLVWAEVSKCVTRVLNLPMHFDTVHSLPSWSLVSLYCLPLWSTCPVWANTETIDHANILYQNTAKTCLILSLELRRRPPRGKSLISASRKKAWCSMQDLHKRLLTSWLLIWNPTTCCSSIAPCKR